MWRIVIISIIIETWIDGKIIKKVYLGWIKVKISKVKV